MEDAPGACSVAMEEEFNDERKVPVHVEVCLKPEALVDHAEVADAVARFVEGRTLWYRDGPLDLAEADHPLLREHVAYARVCDTDPSLHRLHSPLLFWQYTVRVYVYQLCDEGPVDDDEGEEGLPSYRELLLPATELAGQWEALQFDSAVKQRLLSYATSALLFSDCNVDPNLVSWNRVVLLYGPPGTGKTSLCKALAHKLSIRLASRYRSAALVEVNAHSLFSKYFSESGKLVSRLFTKITELVEEEDSLVFVLIDEVESLTSARKAAVSGSEPSDAIRAVNALLTQLDALRRHPNALVLTTSNITQAIDVAFVDRADIKAYIGPPSLPARYEMLRSSVCELGRAGIIAGDVAQLLLPYAEAATAAATPTANGTPYDTTAAPAHHPNHQHPLPNGAPHPAAAPSAAAELCGTAQPYPTPPSSSLPHPTPHGNGLAAPSFSTSSASAAGSAGTTAATHHSGTLLRAAAACEGLSGRTLRKLPFLAHAGRGGQLAVPCGLGAYLCALWEAVGRENEDREQLASG